MIEIYHIKMEAKPSFHCVLLRLKHDKKYRKSKNRTTCSTATENLDTHSRAVEPRWLTQCCSYQEQRPSSKTSNHLVISRHFVLFQSFVYEAPTIQTREKFYFFFRFITTFSQNWQGVQYRCLCPAQRDYRKWSPAIFINLPRSLWFTCFSKVDDSTKISIRTLP